MATGPGLLRRTHLLSLGRMAPPLLTCLLARCSCFRPQQPQDPKVIEQATRVQAVVRGHLSRRQQVSSSHGLTAKVEGVKVSAEGSSKVTTYVVVVQQKAKRWEVEHRYSDWVQLHARLGQILGKNTPALPPKTLVPGLRDTSTRKRALDRYLQQAIALTEEAPKARSDLLHFLSTSHLYWRYAGSAAESSSPNRGSASRRVELSKHALSLSSFKEEKDQDPFFRSAQDLMAVTNAKGDELGACERWLPEKTAQENRAYWLRVLGT